MIDLFSSYIPEDRSMTFQVINDQGFTVECEVLFTFESEETEKNYIVYTDNTIDDDGNTKVYASIYNPEKDETKLLPIETDKEWKIIETILEELQEESVNNIDLDSEEQIRRIDERIAQLEREKSDENADDDDNGFDDNIKE